MATLQKVEIFSDGTWNGREFTTEDLDAMAGGFEDEQQSGRLPVKLGHDAPDTAPAAGWISRVWREGRTLFATLADVSEEVAQGIRDGRWRFCSVELLHEVRTAAGRSYRWLLDGLALLGSARPGVEGLKPLHESLSRRARGLTFAERLICTRQFTETFTMQDEITQLRERLASTTQALVALTLEDAVRSKRIVPASREMFHKRYQGSGTVQDALEWIATSPRPVQFARPATHAPDYTGGVTGGPDAQLVERVRAHIDEHFRITQGRERLDFSRAASEVMREMSRREPSLLEAWRLMNGETD